MHGQGRRAAIHAALGDPARLAIVDDLLTGDRSPSELARRIQIPGNLLAHHLDVLQGIGVIERFVSSGDRRRRYVRLLPRVLDGLTVSPRQPSGRVLFVCSRNMARSQLAAALWRLRTGEPADSAGTRPADRIHPQAIAAARRRGIDVPDVAPRQITGCEVASTVITVCDRAHEELEPGPDWLHWSITDPIEIGTDDAFDDTLNQLDARIRALTTLEVA